MSRDYTYSELMAMQEEATQRVREMQRRAQLTAQRAQEELDNKKDAVSPPAASKLSPAGKAPAAPPRKEGAAQRREPSGQPLPPAPEWTAPPVSGGVDAERFSFLDSEPQRPQPPAGKPRPQKHISLPVDFIQEKRESPPPPREEDHRAADAPEQPPDPGGKLPFPLGLTDGGSDQSLLLALMLLLNGEGTDELLLLALLYIMM